MGLQGWTEEERRQERDRGFWVRRLGEFWRNCGKRKYVLRIFCAYFCFSFKEDQEKWIGVFIRGSRRKVRIRLQRDDGSRVGTLAKT